MKNKVAKQPRFRVLIKPAFYSIIPIMKKLSIGKISGLQQIANTTHELANISERWYKERILESEWCYDCHGNPQSLHR